MVAQVRQVIDGIIEVDVLVEIIAVVIPANVERAAHRDMPSNRSGLRNT